MSMEIQSRELTIAEMLRIHRAWITMLFVEQKKTEAEIVQLLYERNIFISLHRIRLLLQEWQLISPSSSSSPSTRTSAHPQEGRGSTSTVNQPESRSAYEQRPLPSLPPSTRSSSSRRAKESTRASSPRHHSSQPETSSSRRRRPGKAQVAPSAHYSHEGSSPLEDYVMDAQSHEMIAIGLIKPRWSDRSHL